MIPIGEIWGAELNKLGSAMGGLGITTWLVFGVAFCLITYFLFFKS